MKVYFSHGKRGTPQGIKIEQMAKIAAKYGCKINSVDYTDTIDSELRVERLLNLIKNEDEELILVGSSMGGYASLVVAEQIKVRGLFLLAPALY